MRVGPRIAVAVPLLLAALTVAPRLSGQAIQRFMYVSVVDESGADVHD